MDQNLNEYRRWLDQLLDKGQTVQVPVHGMSMFPILMPRDTVQIRRIKWENLNPGQVLVFECEGKWIAHRLIAVNQQEKSLLTRGDGLPAPDKPIMAEKVKGVIVKIIKTRSPFAWTINTSFDRFMVFAGPLSGKVFWFLGRVVSWGLRVWN
ncbi:S24/S26 family peptidase [Marinilabilia rubra]|uniref:Peptidase S24 n=1 Tax=Marinilabilia rubra TaxID=2162893 RepID=A0A2U2BA82_9BACT|nr:S24 family peptidase [Marinilabilia rubra]PWD99964.1 peptidase S24 [Marinilabilia rubra]